MSQRVQRNHNIRKSTGSRVITSHNFPKSLQVTQKFITEKQEKLENLPDLKMKTMIAPSKSAQLVKASQLSYQNHSCARLPLVLNPAFHNKYTSPIRNGFLKFVQNYPELGTVNESMLLEEFATQKKLNFLESHDQQTRTHLRQKHLGIGMEQEGKKLYKKPKLRYFQLDDSDIKDEDVDNIINHKKNVKQKKGRDLPLDKIFKHKDLEKNLNELVLKTNRGKQVEESTNKQLYTSTLFISQAEVQ